MLESRKSFYAKHKTKLISAFIAVFCITCLDLCAEEISTAQAKVYRENLVTEAKKYIGCPYVYGAVGPDSFDCSGLVYYVAKQVNGTQLPRTAKALYSYAKIVPDKQKEPGDLVFFKTTSSGNVSHVGIYIGNNQFISALSDGPNNGVILSSLNEAYWKPKYIGVGQIYKSGKIIEEDDFIEEPFEDDESDGTGSSGNFLDNLVFDGSVYGGWSLLQPGRFMINFRGIDLQSNARYAGIPLSPGIGFSLRYNAGLNVFQIPVMLSVTPSEYLRIYMGPVFTFGNPDMTGTDKEITQTILPGIIGVSLATPSLIKKKIKLQIVQDISYSVCSTEDGAALNFFDSIAAGLVFYTGVRVTLPFKIFTSK